MDLSDTCVIVIPFPSIAARRNPVGFYLCGVTCSLAVMAVMFYVTESNLLSIIRFPKVAKSWPQQYHVRYFVHLPCKKSHMHH